jgi:hypothetical protein
VTCGRARGLLRAGLAYEGHGDHDGEPGGE